MTDTTPLPCPFCGGSNLRVAYMRATSDCAFWRVECADPTCDAGTYGPSANTEAEALTAWNTRANADARLVEALRGLAGNAGALKAFEWEIREVCGNTNWQCLMDAIAKADAALSEVSHG